VRVGLYEEFPVPWRLEKLERVDFPVTLTVAAPSRVEFLQLREQIEASYPVVEEVYFWPVLSHEEGYYPGTWSDPVGVRRVALEAADLPVLWDLELPLHQPDLQPEHWLRNRDFLSRWLARRETQVQIWRSHWSMGLDPLFLRVVGLHYDPRAYKAVKLQMEFYMTGEGMPTDTLKRILRCGVEQYGERFVPSFGVLNDGEGPGEIFVPPETLRRNLRAARAAGVQEVWLFGVNGLNEDYLNAVRAELPLAPP
jgi:hypothetical protein